MYLAKQEQEKLEQDRRQLLPKPPVSVRALQLWIFVILKIWLSCYKICENHNSLLEYFAARFFQKYPKTILLGARGIGKSYMSGLECWMKARFYPGWAATILGGSLEQSDKVYSACQDFWGEVADIQGDSVLKSEPRARQTEFRNGSEYTLLAASQKSARGPHPVALFLDEVDEMDRSIFLASLLQPQSTNEYEASWAITSTRHRAGGIMEDYVDHAGEYGYQLFNICILEAMKPCYGYSCSTCQLAKWCGGRMKTVIAQAEKDQQELGIIEKGQPCKLGFNAVSDVINKVTLGTETTGEGQSRRVRTLDIDSELFNRRASKSGLVYKMFDPLIHVKNDMNIPQTWKRYRSFDFGFQNPWVSLFIAVDEADRIYVYDEICVTGQTTDQMAKLLTGYERDAVYEFNVADPAGAGDRAILRNHGIPTWYHKEGVAVGIQAVINILQVRLDGTPGIYISSKCSNLIWEMSKGYCYPDDNSSENPVKLNDHSCDALKNFICVWQRPESSSQGAIYVSYKEG